MIRRRTPLRRAPLEQRQKLRPVSAKQARVNRERAKLRVKLREERGVWCEARLPGCKGKWTDLHELKRRSQGGDPTDGDGILCLCSPCHRFATERPAEAHDLGLVKWGWES